MKFIKKLYLLIFLLIPLTIMIGCRKQIKFDVNFYIDGTLYYTVGTSGKDLIEMPRDPSKIDHTFEGWYWDEDIWLKPFTAQSLLETPLSQNMNVYAYFLHNDEPHGVDLQFNSENLVSCTQDGTHFYLSVHNDQSEFSFKVSKCCT